jgi:branched-subunit amino acid ABC-type transport system permease component
MDVLVATFNLAAIYGLVALGLSLTWAGLNFLNLAHGATFASAGFGALWAAENISDSEPVVFLAGILLGAFSGALIWLVVFIPLDGRENWNVRSITATLALSLIGTYALLEVFGPQSRALPAVFGSDSFSLAGTVITSDRSGSIISAAVVLGLVILALNHTRVGLAVRALTQNVEGAKLVGINRRSAALAVLAVSGALAGFAAVLLSQTIYVSWQAGWTPLVKGMIVALLGGLGSVPGTVIAALLVGATDAVTSRYLGQGYVLMMEFALIAIVLLLRPRGVAGVLEGTRA